MGQDWRPELAEMVGVFLLVLFGCGAAGVDAQNGALGPVGVSLAFAFTLVALVYALAGVCGAHFNPAITLAFAAANRFPWRRVPSYMAAQALGAIAAAFTLKALGATDLGTTTPSIGVLAAFAWETLGSFFLGLVVIGVATDKRAAPGSSGLAIGLAVGVASLALGPLTGASMNPARTLGPALASANFAGLWIYVTAPFVGAALAMALFELVRPGHLPAKALGVAGPIALDKETAA